MELGKKLILEGYQGECYKSASSQLTAEAESREGCEFFSFLSEYENRVRHIGENRETLKQHFICFYLNCVQSKIWDGKKQDKTGERQIFFFN